MSRHWKIGKWQFGLQIHWANRRKASNCQLAHRFKMFSTVQWRHKYQWLLKFKDWLEFNSNGFSKTELFRLEVVYTNTMGYKILILFVFKSHLTFVNLLALLCCLWSSVYTCGKIIFPRMKYEHLLSPGLKQENIVISKVLGLFFYYRKENKNVYC